jgi:hypothetical protein
VATARSCTARSSKLVSKIERQAPSYFAKTCDTDIVHPRRQVRGDRWIGKDRIRGDTQAQSQFESGMVEKGDCSSKYSRCATRCGKEPFQEVDTGTEYVLGGLTPRLNLDLHVIGRKLQRDQPILNTKDDLEISDQPHQKLPVKKRSLVSLVGR